MIVGFMRTAASREASARAQHPAFRRGLWAEVDPGFHVGNERGRFLGSITRLDVGSFAAFGAQSQHLGVFGDLAEAKAAVIGSDSRSSSEVLSPRIDMGEFAR